MKTPDAKSLKQAETIWIQEAQRSLKSQIKKGSYQRLHPTEGDDGIIVVTGHAERWMDISYDNQNLILLPKNHQISKLYSLHIHQSSHLGVDATVAKILDCSFGYVVQQKK